MYLIKKASGEVQEFNEEKFERSLRRAGTPNDLIKQIMDEVRRVKPASTRQLHQLTTDLLAHIRPPIAGRYNLKRALMELGPAGYPFERYVAELFHFQGYKTEVDQIISGKCVDHEVDIVLEKNNKRGMVECKFHNAPGLKSDVKITLYVFARYLDITTRTQQRFDEVWLVTNTKFTTQAEQYAACENIKLLSWNYGPEQSLAHMIDSSGLHPITTLTGLTRRQKREFVKNGFVLCKDVEKHVALLHRMGFSDEEIKHLISEAQQVCTLNSAE